MEIKKEPEKQLSWAEMSSDEELEKEAIEKLNEKLQKLSSSSDSYFDESKQETAGKCPPLKILTKSFNKISLSLPVFKRLFGVCCEFFFNSAAFIKWPLCAIAIL